MSLQGRNLLADSSDTDQCCTTDGCHCSGNPTQRSCPVHRAYAILDPNLKKYDSLDCSVVVFMMSTDFYMSLLMMTKLKE